MSVDVTSEIVISRSCDEVAAYTSDPMMAPAWYVNISSAEHKTQGPLRVGSQIVFRAQFLGRSLEYTYEVIEWVVGSRFVMRTAEGPFPMETTYAWVAEGENTRMTLRNRGQPAGFSRLVAPFMALAMRRANRADLTRLKAILEKR